ncbi:MAG: RHS repeat-associated core domain-containing protein, partial [Bacteroidetes bacterium]|nr:RHS repeat-associated core domain-containing protein [Bacteroidota bacterium]
LGNVRVVFSDHKQMENPGGTFSHYSLDIASIADYYPFGSEMPGRSFNSPDYRYGFNGKEKDDEITGITGSHLDFGARIYDSRLGRWLSVDPIFSEYEDLSPYQFCADMPIKAVDIDGEKIKIVWRGNDGKRHKVKIDDMDDYKAWKKAIGMSGNLWVNDLVKAMSFIEKSNCHDVIRRAVLNTKTLKLKQSKRSYETATRRNLSIKEGSTLSWNSANAYQTPQGEKHAPIVSLFHDIAEFSIENREYYSSQNSGILMDIKKEIEVYLKGREPVEEGEAYNTFINTDYMVISTYEPSFIDFLNQERNLKKDEQSQKRRADEYEKVGGKVYPSESIYSTKEKKEKK